MAGAWACHRRALCACFDLRLGPFQNGDLILSCSIS